VYMYTGLTCFAALIVLLACDRFIDHTSVSVCDDC